MTKSKIKDPYADREAAKYDKPIPSRECILEFLQERGHPAQFDEIATAMHVRDEEQLEALRRRLKAMERDGQLIRNRRQGYGLLRKMGLVRGRVQAHRDGFGFLVPDEGGADLFLPEHQMRALFDGDRIVARISGVDRRGRFEAAVVEVLERGITQFIGRLVVEAGATFVLPDNPRIRQQILIAPEHTQGATPGQIVMAELLIQPTKYSYPIGKVVEIMGQHMAPGMEIDISIRSHNLPYLWSEAVEEEIKSFSTKVAEKDKQKRLDLRDLPLVTIDGEDARDFDDAVYCEPTATGWRLFVAIADVSHYVKMDSALDVAAQERGNSVYFPERVIPMLPEILSNGLCSLNPMVDRLCMVCEVHLNKTGVVKHYEFHNAVMNSKARLTYEAVAEILEGNNPALNEKYASLATHLQHLKQLYSLLKKRRQIRGAIDFEIPETKIIFGADRKIERIVSRDRNDAHRLIEECMLLANVCAAAFLQAQAIPALYRNHTGPSPDKLADLRKFINELGLSLEGGDEPLPKHYAKVLEQAAGRTDALLIQTVLLRSLSQAMYQAESEGHFGLAYDSYAHFTSPIRRYPDLLVHRAIKYALAKGKSKAYPYDLDKMAKIGSHCSMTERRADDATREATNWLRCEFMMDKVGQTFDGMISGVTGFGVFVTLKNIFVDGLVHITSLKNDYYRFDPIHHRLTGERGGKLYRIGDNLRVTVVRVDLDERKIDFELAENLSTAKEPGKKAASSAAKPKQKKKEHSKKKPAEAAPKSATKKAAKPKKAKRKKSE